MKMPDEIYVHEQLKNYKMFQNILFETKGSDKYYHSSVVEALKAENDEVRKVAAEYAAEIERLLSKKDQDEAAEIEILKAELAKRQWVKTKDRLPEKPGKKSYEYVDCLIYHNGEILQRPWNCEHLCWDDAHYDDFFLRPFRTYPLDATTRCAGGERVTHDYEAVLRGIHWKFRDGCFNGAEREAIVSALQMAHSTQLIANADKAISRAEAQKGSV